MEMFVRNTDLREAKGRIPMWAIAERLDISEQTLIRWFRADLEESKKSRIMDAIKEIKVEMLKPHEVNQ